MLVIRKEQMDALSAHMRKRFEDRMVEHLAASYPAQFKKLTEPDADDQPVRALIREGVARGGQFQIEAERDLALFIELMVIIDPRFDELPDMKWARTILDSQGIPAQAKMQVLWEQWQERHAS